MKKILSIILALTVLCGLAGCGHEHRWAEATCTEPRTCTVCGETEGEALGHDWQDATCTAPRTCARCGETEGEALGHTLTGANYQDAAVCTVCGETVGEPLTPDFVTYGITTGMEVGVHYDYETICYMDTGIKTVGDLVVLDYSVIDFDDTHEAKEGYEWRVATFQALFSDENAQRYGYQPAYCREDYYNIRLNDDSAVFDDDGNATFTVNYHGEDMECAYRNDILSNEWRDLTANFTFRVSYQVPVGYDGCVFGMCDFDAVMQHTDDMYLFDIYDPDTFHLFRFA